jgi:hypothetical protein
MANIMTMKHTWLLMMVGAALAFTASGQNISATFDEQERPAAPDYADEKYWSALPWRVDVANDVPSDEFVVNQETAPVDVFYIHPTTINSKYDIWNAFLNDEEMNKKVDELPVRHQASIFNEKGKVFAPRYRQANYEAFLALSNPSSQKALALAYSDVRAAFLHFLENWNEGRPFVIAAHSQGTFHAMKLLEEFVDTTGLRHRMVAAYLVGMPVKENQYKNIPPCENEFDTNCFLTWNTMKKKNFPKFYDEYYDGVVCHNPLSWECTEYDYCSKDYHLGGVPRDFRKMFRRSIGAQVVGGVLWVDGVKLPGIPLSTLVKNWHIGDYNLFYVNIRNNFAVRVKEFLQNNPTQAWQKANSESEVK